MSVPDTKALSPAPRRMRTRTESSVSIRRQISPMRSYIAKVIALRASGRLKVSQAMPDGFTSKRISSLMPAS
jgi:hypothetical protein